MQATINRIISSKISKIKHFLRVGSFDFKHFWRFLFIHKKCTDPWYKKFLLRKQDNTLKIKHFNFSSMHLSLLSFIYALFINILLFFVVLLRWLPPGWNNNFLWFLIMFFVLFLQDILYSYTSLEFLTFVRRLHHSFFWCIRCLFLNYNAAQE